MLSLFLAALKNRRLISYGLAFLSAFSLGWYVHSRIAEHTLQSALASQQAALIQACEIDKAKTERIDHDHQNKISELSRRVAAYKLHKPATCMRVTDTASLNNGKTGSGLVGADVVNSESLTEYAELAESYRLRLVSCQNFIRLERDK